MFLKCQPFLSPWLFRSTTFQKLPKWPKLCQISKSQNFYPKFAPGIIFILFDHLETKLRSRQESNIAPMGLPKNIFCKYTYQNFNLKGQKFCFGWLVLWRFWEGQYERHFTAFKSGKGQQFSLTKQFCCTLTIS